MFNKIVFGISLLIVLALEAVPGQIKQSVRFTIAVGTLWDNDSFHNDFLWILGISGDFYLDKNLTLNPEFNVASKELGFKNFLLQPGLMLNYHIQHFFMGAGVVDEIRARNNWSFIGMDYPPTVVWHVVWSNVWKYKICVGFEMSKIRFMAVFLSRFDDIGWFPTAASNSYGATIGYTF